MFGPDEDDGPEIIEVERDFASMEVMAARGDNGGTECRQSSGDRSSDRRGGGGGVGVSGEGKRKDKGRGRGRGKK